ncbi:MAG: DNA polymerase IV [Sandaracinus sp.]|nr:DNA polymerase IV [Sandaracinus sp.]
MDDRQILHVDMDAFYASVEQRDDPALRGKPVIVGGRSRRGVVAAASYEVRRFGVRSAMSMVEALARCPDAIVVSPRMRHYADVSAGVFAVFHRFTPLVEGLSFDEAFLDVTGSRRLFGDGVAIARQIKAAIRDELDLTASAGVAPSKFVAKVASDLDKPDGLVVVAPEGVEEFLAPLPVERMWGVGKKAALQLHGHGFHTLGDLARTDPGHLEALLGSWGRSIHALARGDDSRPVIPDRDAKSIGAEETFEGDLHTVEELERPLLHQAGRVAARLSQNGLRAGCITVKLKYRDHTSKTRQLKLPEPVADTDSIYDAARSLLPRFPSIARGIRLTGVSASDLHEGPAAPTLFPDERRAKRERIEALTGELRERFGAAGVKRGRLVAPPDDDDH